MFTMHSMVLMVHVLISAGIIGLVLLQRGKGADAGAAFGSGASGTVFGARGSANFLSRTTGVLATAFFLTSLSLAYLGSRQAPVESLMNQSVTETQPAPSLMALPDEVVQMNIPPHWTAYVWVEDLEETVASALEDAGLAPDGLELEVTESLLMDDPREAAAILGRLQSRGVHISIDDFGTGYSSLSALQQFPISTLKIDKSFVRDVATNPDDATIVGTIVQMGRNLNLDVVAEGVENEDQLNVLQRLDCTYVQGLLFGDPMSADNYLELLLAQADGTDSYRALFA